MPPTMGKVIRTTPGVWRRPKPAPQVAPHEIVVTFSDRRPLRIRYFVNRKVAEEAAEGMLGRTLVGDGFSVPTDTATSVVVVPDGEGPGGAEELRVPTA